MEVVAVEDERCAGRSGRIGAQAEAGDDARGMRVEADVEMEIDRVDQVVRWAITARRTDRVTGAASSSADMATLSSYERGKWAPGSLPGPTVQTLPANSRVLKFGGAKTAIRRKTFSTGSRLREGSCQRKPNPSIDRYQARTHITLWLDRHHAPRDKKRLSGTN